MIVSRPGALCFISAFPFSQDHFVGRGCRTRSLREQFERSLVALASLWVLTSLVLSPAAGGQSSVTLAWTGSTTPDVTSYNVYYGVVRQTYTNIIPLGNVTTAVVPGLLQGATYYFAVTAVDAQGLESIHSNEIGYTVPTTNTAPSIASITNQTIVAGTSTGTLAFTVSDAQTATTSLIVSASSSNVILVPNANIVLGGSGANRTVTVTPAAGQFGTSAITLTVSDGQLSSSTSFLLTVNQALAPVVTLTSPPNGAAYTAPASITLAASVTANGHTITKVQFYSGSSLLAEDTTAPYSFSYSNVTAGTYVLKAVAVYDAGSTVASASASVTVSAGSISSAMSFASTSGVISAPFYITNTAICQPAYTSVAAGGQALYSFTLGASGDYLISAQVNAPTADNNSFYINIDAQPTDPIMIWDVPTTTGFASQTVSWRGNGTASASSPSGMTAQYAPKIFTLAAGTHQLIVRGREGNCQLGTITITPNSSSPPPVSTPPAVALSTPTNGQAYTAPAIISLTASVTPNGHTIAKVQFYNGSTLLGTTTAAPYTFSWSNVGAGSYVLSAALVYDTSSTITSSAVSVTVNAPPPPPPPSSSLSFASTSGAISAPFYITNSAICQPAYTSVTAGGRAAYSFTAPATADYLVSALVNVPTTDNNSFFVNIDAEPTDPVMIWDVPITTGFASRTVSWRGNATASSSSPSGMTAQYAPKVFNITSGTHQLIVRGREGNCQLGTIIIVQTSVLPAPWQALDIGIVGVTGSSGITNTFYTVSGAGSVGGTTDGFRFLYQSLSGDGEIRAQINSLQSATTNSCAGVMIRESLTSGSKYALMEVTSGSTFQWQLRGSTSGSSVSTLVGTAALPNTWVRLVRTGGAFYGYWSLDGMNWTSAASVTNAMAANIYIGLAVASGTTTTASTSTFGNVTVVP
jgi:Bacterial Ig domain/Fibronectin type III domain